MKQIQLTVVFMLLLAFNAHVFAQQIRPIKMPALVKEYQQGQGILVVNFWSTWCQPCIEEIPHFIDITNQYKKDSVQLWLVSQDTKKLYESGALLQYVQQKKWKTNLLWLNETNADYYCPLVDNRWSGAIPATVIIRPSTGYYEFYEESLSKEALRSAIQKAINSAK